MADKVPSWARDIPSNEDLSNIPLNDPRLNNINPNGVEQGDEEDTTPITSAKTKEDKKVPAWAQDLTLSTEKTSKTKIEQKKPSAVEDDSSDFVRNLEMYVPQTKQVYYGAKTLLGKQLGSEELVKSGLKGYEEASQTLAPLAKESDTFSNAWKKGIGTVVTDWVPAMVGQGVGMLGESLAFAGVGSLVGTAIEPGGGTIGGAIEGFIGKNLIKKGLEAEVKKIAETQGEKAATAFVEQEAKKFIASEAGQKAIKKEIGQYAGLSAMAGLHGEGEVMGRAIDEATTNITDPNEKLKVINELSTGRLTSAATVHALGDFIASKVGLGALDGLAKPTQSFLLNVAKTYGVTTLQEIPAELLQTAMERFGAELPLADKNALQEYIDTAAATAGMTLVPGIGGGVKSSINYANEANKLELEDIAKNQDNKEMTRENIKNASFNKLVERSEELKAKKQKAEPEVNIETTPFTTVLDDTTLTSWGLNKNSKAYKGLLGVDASTPEGMTKVEDLLGVDIGSRRSSDQAEIIGI